MSSQDREAHLQAETRCGTEERDGGHEAFALQRNCDEVYVDHDTTEEQAKSIAKNKKMTTVHRSWASC